MSEKHIRNLSSINIHLIPLDLRLPAGLVGRGGLAIIFKNRRKIDNIDLNELCVSLDKIPETDFSAQLFKGPYMMLRVLTLALLMFVSYFNSTELSTNSSTVQQAGRARGTRP